MTVVETAMFSTAVVETAGASQTHQALERARAPFGEKSIFNSLATLFDVIQREIQRRLQRIGRRIVLTRS